MNKGWQNAFWITYFYAGLLGAQSMMMSDLHRGDKAFDEPYIYLFGIILWPVIAAIKLIAAACGHII